MKDLLGLLQYVEASSEALAIAKGLNYLPKNLSEVHKRNKKLIAWHRSNIKM